MPKICTNISLDPQLKKEATDLFDSLGLDLSTAITLFLSQSVREQRIPFEITKQVMNKDTLDALNEFEEMKENNKKYKRYDSFKKVMEEI